MPISIRPLVRLALVALLIVQGATACIPYTVGSTAQTVPDGQTTHASSWYFVPNAFKGPHDSIAAPMAGMDNEWRHGVDAKSDVGFRLVPTGVVLNYKHRVTDAQAGRPAVAYMVGGGVVNFGEHMHLEATLIASGDESSSMMPFGGLRAMQVIPISAGAVKDSPTIGAFGGFQLGDAAFSIRPELGVYYDHSALGVRSSNVIFVPAVTLQRGRRRHEAQTIAPQRIQGASPAPPLASGMGDLVRCALGFCAGPAAPPHSVQPMVP
jgi:hypothetical protein